MTKKLVASRLRQAPSAEESRSHMGMSFVGDPRKKKSRFSSGQGPNRPKKREGLLPKKETGLISKHMHLARVILAPA